jgi:tyrosine-protein phosphatase SIW14
MRARSLYYALDFLFRARAGYADCSRTYFASSIRSAWRFHVPRIWIRSINVCEFPVKRKTQNVVGVFVLRLFVVVPFPRNFRLCNGFGGFSATLETSESIMKNSRLVLSFVVLSAVPLRFSAQTPSPAAPPSMHSAYAEKLRIPGVPNSGKINDHLYRGAQPRQPGFAELKKIGITTIVDLREENPAQIAWEQKAAESLGIRFLHIPVPGWSPPTDEQVAQFLSVFRENPREKVFVHCHFGDDRTGVFVATYRMAYEKLPPDQALKEMYHFGFNGMWHPSMASFVRDFPAQLMAAPTLSSFKDIK